MSVCSAVPDPPRNLQLSCDHGEDGKVEVSWNPPDKGHGLIREYIVSSFSSASQTASNLPVHLTTTTAFASSDTLNVLSSNSSTIKSIGWCFLVKSFSGQS